MKKNAISIHSTYSPEKEAERFIRKQDIKQGSYLFLVIGAGQGYLSSTLVRLYPDSRIISFYLDDELFFSADRPERSWHPGSSISLSAFLSSEIEDLFIPLLNFIQWEPCRKAFPDQFTRVLSAIHHFINERNASIVTTVNFGRRWIRNAFLNLLQAETIVTLRSINQPVVITAAGPSLTSTLPALSASRNSFFLLALPSSLMALHNFGIIPDLIVNTDPGFWNSYHFMRYPYKHVPIAMPLTASFHKGENPVLLVNQKSFLEDSLCRSFPIPPVHLLQNGTVAGTALFLACKISSAPVIFSGLDLSYDDIHEHVTPHAFHTLMETKQTRITPLLSLLFKRKFDRLLHNSLNNQDRAFHTYEAWFNQTKLKKNIYRLNPSSIELNSFKNLDLASFTRMVKPFADNNYQFTTFHFSFESRKGIMEAALKQFLKQIQVKKHEITDFHSLDTFISFLKSDPTVYELLELTELQKILKAVKMIAVKNILQQKDIAEIFSRTEQYIGLFHA